MKKLLPALPLLLVSLLAACESAPRYRVAGPDQSIEVLGRSWTVTQISSQPLYFRAVREQGDYFLFGPPSRTKSAQALAALEGATGCKVLRSTMYRNVSDHFYSQMDCSANPSAVSSKVVWDPTPVY